MLPKPSKHPLFNCGKLDCPVCMKAYSVIQLKKRFSKEHYSTQGVAPFIGRFWYPAVQAGVFAPPESFDESWKLDAPRQWAADSLALGKIVEYRSSLMNSRSAVHVRETGARARSIMDLQEISMASKPVDVEIELKKRPFFRINTDSYIAPSGPVAQLKEMDITSNPKIPVHIEKVYNDIDLKAADALGYLQKHGYDETYLMRVFSTGVMGMKKDRKMVPTRWSITATDSTLGNHIVKQIKDCPVGGYQAYFGGYLGNYFLVLVFPDVWQYELFEMLAGSSHYTTDFEPYDGRKSYVEETAGGFYASRLAVLEKLKDMKRQGSCLVLRFITGDYLVPLGVWVVREAVRKTMMGGPLTFSSKELLMSYAKAVAKRKFNYDIEPILGRSRLLADVSNQAKLGRYL